MGRTLKTASLALIAVALSTSAGAQLKVPPAPADYGQWETLVSQPRGGLSPDGKWIVYGVNHSNRNNELRITDIALGSTTTAAFGSQPAFSADSTWIAYAVGYSEAQEEKMRQQKKPVQRAASCNGSGTTSNTSPRRRGSRAV